MVLVVRRVALMLMVVLSLSQWVRTSGLQIVKWSVCDTVVRKMLKIYMNCFCVPVKLVLWVELLDVLIILDSL